MRKLLLDILILVLLVAGSSAGHCQTHIVLVNGYTLLYDGALNPSGTIVDDGDSTAMYSNGFYGAAVISANPGDTIIVSGSYSTEATYDYIYLYNGSAAGDLGTMISSWTGSGWLTDTSYTGYLSVIFSTDGSETRDGFVLHYEVHPSSCSSNILSFATTHVGATSVILGWVATDTTVSYLLHYGTTDTTVTGSTCTIDGLSPNSDYTFTIIPEDDTGGTECLRTLTLHTTCFPAVVSGIRPLCGLDVVTLVADTADGYLWSTGSTARSIAVADTGWYWLVTFTNGGCTDTMTFRIGNIELDLETHLPTALCPGDTSLITVGMAEGVTIRVLRGESTMTESSRIFLPDGVYCDPNGCSYRSEFEFTGFESSAHISDVNDIRYVMLNIEHSYIGDIYINITCPNNQSADILRYGGSGSSSCNSSIASGSRGWQSGSNVPTYTYLGEAYDVEGYPTCDSSAYNNEPGVGWRYCWSNCTDAGYSYAAGDGLIYRSSNSVYSSVGSTIDSSNVAAGTHFYHPDVSFASLIGCPMNGIWYIEVIDGWSGDNGYIFGWELALNPDRLSRDEYVPTVASADIIGEYATRRSDTSFVITAPLHLTADTTITYTVLITDSLGCVFDTSFTVLFHATATGFVYDTVDENDLPYSYGGRLFTSDTNVAFHYPSSSGCDSLLVYDLHVRPNSRATFDTTLCDNSLPYQWHHRVFYAAGTQYDTLVSHLGTDSILTLNLYVSPSYQMHLYDTICSNQSLTFEGTTYTTAGNYPHHFLSSHGCDSLRTLHLATLSTTQGDTFATACDQYVWQGNTFTTSGTLTMAAYATNAVGCDSAVTLHVTINDSYTTHRYDTICSGDSILFAGQYYAAAGIYSHTFTSQQGCDSMVLMHLHTLPVTYGDYYDTCFENQLPHHFSGLTIWDDTTAVLTLVNSQQCDSLLTYHLHVLRNSYAVFDTTFCDNYLPLQWYHRIFYTAGTQYDTITNSVGADSLLTLTLHVSPTDYDTLVVAVCDNGYTWHDSTYLVSTSDAYFSTLNTYGCDSTVNLHLTVNYSTDSTITVEACDSYNWFGTNYLVQPVVSPSYTFTNAVGCDSILHLHLTLHYSQQIFDYDTVCQSDVASGYTWHDTVMYGITASSSYILPRTDRFGCDSTYYLDLTVHGSTSSNVFDTIVENQASTWHYNGIPFANDTVAALTLTNHWGCDSNVTYHLYIWRNTYTQVDTSICNNQLATFTWHGMAAADTLVATLVGSHGVDSVVTLALHVNPTYQTELYDTICDDASVLFVGQTLTIAGDYAHTFLSQQGCDSTVTLHLTVHPTYSHHLYDTIYMGDTVVFDDSAYFQPGDYPIHYQSLNGCDSLVTLHILGRHFVYASRTDSVCEGDTFYFCGLPLVEAGVYTDTAYSGDFFAGDTIMELTLVVVPQPAVFIRRTFVCDPPAHYVLTGTCTAPYMRWYGPSGIEGHELDSIIAILSPADTTIYTLYGDYRPEPMCPVTVDMELPPIPTVTALIDVRPTALTLEERHLTAMNVSSGQQTGHLWYVFYNDESPFTDTAYRLQLEVPMYVDSLAIALKVRSDMCTSIDTVHIDVLRADIMFPNVFTPSVGSNSFFRAYTTAVSDFELWIYDRRGALVFHTTDIEQGWDGTHDGRPLPQAAYVYKCRYRDQLTPSGYQNLTGTVTLIR